MSLLVEIGGGGAASFPRVSGDEPATSLTAALSS